MGTRSLCRWLWLGLAFLACEADGRPGVYPGSGVVREVHLAARQLLIAHEEISGLMPAMTMTFDVADAVDLEALEQGHEVDFQLEFTGEVYRVVEVTVLGKVEGASGGGRRLDAIGERDLAPDFALTDQDGSPLALGDLRGRLVLLDFIYTQCPGPCPIQSAARVRLQRALPPELRERTHFVSISLDPTHDTPQALRAYADAHGADTSDWSFLTGDPELVSPLVRSYGVGTLRSQEGTLEHVLALFLIDGDGRIARRYLGLEHGPDEVMSDLRELL